MLQVFFMSKNYLEINGKRRPKEVGDFLRLLRFEVGNRIRTLIPEKEKEQPHGSQPLIIDDDLQDSEQSVWVT